MNTRKIQQSEQGYQYQEAVGQINMGGVIQAGSIMENQIDSNLIFDYDQMST